eukprot:TRINITY_DN11296_c0_g1_i1.p1 TRINITY_DN11296_c0_g1~~TRINITY_DN11296_c0_g1_i1.p1  ORF type:complete len:227 (+),score=40.05 TRINITY_DN11296_c0_g1_i1:31-711(+)
MKCIVHVPATGDEVACDADSEEELRQKAAAIVGFDCQYEHVAFESDTPFEEGKEPFYATVKFVSTDIDSCYSEIINKLLIQSDDYQEATETFRAATRPQQSKHDPTLSCKTMARHDNWGEIPYRRRKLARRAIERPDAGDCLLLFWGQSHDKDAPDNLGRSPVWHAARLGRTQNLQELLNLGADPCQPDNFGHTPLWIAAKMGHTAIVQLLVKHGADPETINKEIP